MYMCICIYVYVYTCIYVCECIYISLPLSLSINIYMYVRRVPNSKQQLTPRRPPVLTYVEGAQVARRRHDAALYNIMQ